MRKIFCFLTGLCGTEDGARCHWNWNWYLHLADLARVNQEAEEDEHSGSSLPPPHHPQTFLRLALTQGLEGPQRVAMSACSC